MSHSVCCVVSCKNNGRNSNMKFYSFPRARWKQEQRVMWILAVNRKNADGSLWFPKPHDAICNAHFIGGKKSEEQNSPSYVPTIFATPTSTRVNANVAKSRYKRKRKTKIKNKIKMECKTKKENKTMCRVCLKTDCKLYKMEDNDTLCNMYQLVTGLVLSEEERLPRTVCPECSSWLLDCDRFKTTSLQSNSVLQQTLQKHGSITPESIESIIKLHTKDEQTQQCGFDNKLVIKEEDTQTDQQVEMAQSPVISDDVIALKNNLERDLMNGLDDVKEDYQYDDIENIGIDNVTSLQETAADPLKVENEDLTESGVDGQLNIADREHGAGFADEDYPSSDDLPLTELIQPKILQDDKPTIRDTCQKQERFAHNLKRNLQIHSNERVHKCNICDKEFKTITGIRKHKLIHSSEKPYTCNVCLESFTAKKDLREHMIVHSEGTRVLICNICCKTYKEKRHLLTHLKIHSDVKPHTCNICHKGFRSKYILQNHLTIHSGEKPHSCRVGKRISFKHDLQSKPHKCNISCRAFKGKDVLQRHLRIHSEKNPIHEMCVKRDLLL